MSTELSEVIIKRIINNIIAIYPYYSTLVNVISNL